jgi:hypothetical protein
MADISNYISEITLLDVTVSELAAGVAITSPTSGSVTVNGCTIGITPIASMQSTALSNTQRGDYLHVYCLSPVTSPGVYPDFRFWFNVDKQSMQKYLELDGSYQSNMAPWPWHVKGGPVDRDGKYVGGFTLGKSTRSVLGGAASGKPTKNQPMEITGYKAQNQFQVTVVSNAGFTAPEVPARIIVTGELLTQEMIAYIAAGWVPSVYKQTIERVIDGKSPLTFTHKGVVSFAGWTTLPGGIKQSGPVVNRLGRFSVNAVATGSQKAFVLTQNNQLNGNQANVTDEYHDLGFDTFTNVGEAFDLKGFGCRPGTNQAYLGWAVGGDFVPNDTGFDCSPDVNRFNFGDQAPQAADDGESLIVPRYPGEFLVYGEQAVPFIQAAGTAIAANASEVAIDGVYCEKVS